jgi:hypothetical protein
MEDILKSSLMTSYRMECLEEENTRLGKVREENLKLKQNISSLEEENTRLGKVREENLKLKESNLLLEKVQELNQKLSKSEGIYLILCLIIMI